MTPSRRSSLHITLIVLALSVCVSVRPSHNPGQIMKWTNIQAWISACRSRVKISRSSSKVIVIDQRSRSPSTETSFCGMHSLAILVVEKEMNTKDVNVASLSSSASLQLLINYIRHHIWMVGLQRRVCSKHMWIFLFIILAVVQWDRIEKARMLTWANVQFNSQFSSCSSKEYMFKATNTPMNSNFAFWTKPFKFFFCRSIPKPYSEYMVLVGYNKE